MLMSRWDTSTAEPEKRFELYRSGLCASFAHLTPNPDANAKDFSASLTNWADGIDALTRVSSKSHSVERSRQDLKQAEDDCLYVNYIASGEMCVRQGNAATRLRKGDLIVLDNARPFEAQTVAKRINTHFAFRVPRDTIPAELAHNPTHLAHLPGNNLLRQQFSMLADAAPELLDDLIKPAFKTLKAVLSHMVDFERTPTHLLRAAQTKQAVENAIARHYSDPEFSFDWVMYELRMPKRTLQSHLALSGVSFSGLLREFRLNRALEIMSGEACTLQEDSSFEKIALQIGFQDLTTFYRAFKRKFGAAPGQYRGPKKSNFLDAKIS